MNLTQSPITQTMPLPASFYTSVALGYGALVYQSGFNAASGLIAVTKADADATGRPPQWVALENIDAGGSGSFAPLDQVITGILDTSGGSIGDPVYLSATAGLMTLTAPTGAAAVIQVGVVQTVSAVHGEVALFSQNTVIEKLVSGGDVSGPLTITSTSASAIAAGPAGATNPTLQVDASTASAATGVKIKSAAAGAGVAISVISSGMNEAVTLDAKGSGTISIGSVSTGAITLARATSATVSVATPALDGVAPTGAGLIIGAGATSKLGFYGHAVIAQQTGVMVTAGGIHAALVALGLFTA